MLDAKNADFDPDSSMFGQASGPSELYINMDGDDNGDADVRQIYTQTLVPLPIQDLDSLLSDPQNSKNRSKPLPHPHDLIRDEPLFEDDGGKSRTDGGVSATKGGKKGRDSKPGAVGALIPGTFPSHYPQPPMLTDLAM